MATALFVCLHNAGRSQMAAVLFGRAAGGRHRALSAGARRPRRRTCTPRSSRSCASSTSTYPTVARRS